MIYSVRKSARRLLERCLDFAVNCLFHGKASECSVAKRTSDTRKAVFTAKFLAFAKVVLHLFPQKKEAAHGALTQLKCALLLLSFCQKKRSPHRFPLDVTVRTDTINKKC
ncbi:MAG: hypothetical protein [Microviridae sp.]|nr:MAG: hypothetical protein [Microviridae sp.]